MFAVKDIESLKNTAAILIIPFFLLHTLLMALWKRFTIRYLTGCGVLLIRG